MDKTPFTSFYRYKKEGLDQLAYYGWAHQAQQAPSFKITKERLQVL